MQNKILGRNQYYEKTKSRYVQFTSGADDMVLIIVKTNAPQEVIKNAILYRNEQREENDYCVSDLELIEEYIINAHYSFVIVDVEESYFY